MKLKEIAIKFTTDLALLYEAEEAKAIFFIVLEFYFNIKRSSYAFQVEVEITDEKLSEMNGVLAQLKSGKPIQYILGETIFYGLAFKVTNSVLIPRPETEELVEWVLEKAKDPDVSLSTVNILDIGTGSGCIAISLKKNLPKACVFALDVSREALNLAQQNAILNDVDVSFIEQDILKEPIESFTNQYSIIISNPPYITQTEKAQMHTHVLAHEPHLALFVSNEQPLIFYEAIADVALHNLKVNGLLFFEINEYLGKEMVQMLSDKGFKNIVLRKDMQGKDRMICCMRS